MTATTIRRSFKFRCYPGAQARANASRVMGRVMKPIWNETRWHLEHNRRAVAGVLAVNAKLPKSRRVPVPQSIGQRGPYELISTDLHPEYAGTNAQSREMMQATLHASYQSYWALLKNGHGDARPPGRMKFCGFVTYRQSGWKLEGRTLQLMGIGNIPIRLHRPIRGKIKTVTLRVKNEKWYVCFSCEITDFPGACRSQSEAKTREGKGLGQKHPASGGAAPELQGADNACGIGHRRLCGGAAPELQGADNRIGNVYPWPFGGAAPELRGADNLLPAVGGRAVGGAAPQMQGADNAPQGIVAIWLDVEGQFLCDSEGRRVAVPGFYEKALAEERRLNQVKSRRQPAPGQPSSRNYRNARRTLANFREHVANQRSAFLWAEALYYAKRYDGVILFTRPAKPPIQYARDERTARVLCDGAYGLFEKRLADKCQEYGTDFISKEKQAWQQEKRQLAAQDLMERTRAILWKWRRAPHKDSPAFMAFLAKACESLATLDVA